MERRVVTYGLDSLIGNHLSEKMYAYGEEILPKFREKTRE